MLVLFALMLTVMVAMAGLVLDGGSTFVQRRDQQNASDLAALAGANDLLVNGVESAAIATARRIATANGYTQGVNGATVAVTFVSAAGAGTRVTVTIDAPHRNGFASVMGFSTWPVSTTATALTGVPNTADAPAPFMFSYDVFNADGTPKYTTDTAFCTVNGDVPVGGLDCSWTDYHTLDNLNSAHVKDIIDGTVHLVKTIDFGTYIGQHNNGNHTTLFGYVQTYLAGHDVPAPIVDSNGYFMGWAMFHVTSAGGGSAKDITGYFISGFTNARLTIGACSPSPCSGSTSGGTGTYILQLVD